MTSRDMKIFTLAGIATAPGFMDPFRKEMSLQLRSRGHLVASESIYPYGDWSQLLVRQLAAIFRDLTDIQERLWTSIGARAARASIVEAAQSGVTLVLIGHSGGGVSAVQIAAQLVKEGYRPPLVVQIGSPKCPVPLHLQDHVLFITAVGPGGRKDPVTRLGRWGGWIRKFSYLKSMKAYPPGQIAELPLIGGHPDYFRTHTPYINREGVTNMMQTVQTIVDWLDHRLL